MKRPALYLALLLTACAGDSDDADTFGTETSTSTSDSSSTQDASGSDDSSGVGTDGTGEDGTGEEGDGDGDGDTGDGDGDGDGDGADSASSSGPGDGDGDGDTSGGDGDSEGEALFPGDPCDPLSDLCIDGYNCHSGNLGPVANPEFRCIADQILEGEDGLYGSGCGYSPMCASGFSCANTSQFPDGDCDPTETTAMCCIETCAYEETCGNGATCSIIWWLADLEDYLDDYTGIGICAAP